MQSIKQIKNRIRSVENTKKVTAALQMISVVKFNRVQSRLLALRPFAQKLEQLMHDLSNAWEKNSSPYFKERENSGNLVVVFTSDNGLCGTYNQNLLNLVQDFLAKNKGQNTQLMVIGQRGAGYFKLRHVPVLQVYTGLNGKFDPGLSDKITASLLDLFLKNKAGKIFLAYTYFKNSLVQRPVLEQFLSIQLRPGKPIEYIAEPDLKSIVEELVPQYLKNKMQLVMLESLTSEHAARTISMKTATDNAKELLDGLVLFRNKVRQAGITQDILEITSSAEALKNG